MNPQGLICSCRIRRHCAAVCAFSLAAVYQFCSALGAATALNPVLMAVIEGLSSNLSGISFVLSNYYIRDVNNGTLGVMIALLIDLAFIGCSMLVRHL